MQTLQKEAMNRPAVLRLDEEEEGEGGKEGDSKLHQLSLKAESSSDKFLVCYVILKLRLVQGKSLVFVNSIKQAFKLKLFLQGFYISAAVLNSDLPENSRAFILEEFDKGAFSLLIATDEGHVLGTELAEFGVARGFDFKNVRNVINFDFPTTPESYVHRIGRTARAGAAGNAISFVCNEQEERLLEQASKLLQKEGQVSRCAFC